MPWGFWWCGRRGNPYRRWYWMPGWWWTGIYGPAVPWGYSVPYYGRWYR